ncbi:DNA recombination protein RmuC [Sphingomonas koreensis]|uniref:DNA recombination protein RmuC homolog n=1 Tax=Sphingomonas koreensis TaxID=93064 RepID=A0A1L6JAM5_9SPHN|nr:DNA recombination protein RmuC [Sphingomonas koreensis]APR52988.1 recombinase RmuC [Sphingomonas koreensis]MDC7811348.1 DNA recombination protein RmuC [Sphingomonas koreensis]RSU18182.1 DNA recombination protein RmuC [Sphingomonas koreensis]RSU23492.1 DNA recombination protein RmuC [Sphingomonas koreensis]RSU25280.1 DNA recombination protein RmuC [Sphingomonas koreensis]
MTLEFALALIFALLAGGAAGWFAAARRIAEIRAERDKREADFKAAIIDLAGAEERLRELPELRDQLDSIRDERDIARLELTELRTKASAFEERLEEFKGARELMAGQFRELAGQMLSQTQEAFLKRAEDRFRQSEVTAGQNLKALLQPVNERLQRYEEGVAKVEAERRDAFGELKGQIEQMRIGQERVSSEAAKLVNSLRNAPKSRGRWGEQQLKNVLETCGLSEHTDFETEVSVAQEEGGRLRPDAIVRVPGGKALVIDAKVSLNAYQDAFGAVEEGERQAGLAQHAAAMKAHVNALGNKAYWTQFDDAPDYVIMFVPGEHFLSAALEHDHSLWDFAFEKRVLLATPTNLIAIARTVAAVWRQEKLAKEARQIGELGKELYDRLAKAMGDLRLVGSGLNSAVKNFNTFASSLETRALVSARKLKELNVETGAREIESVASVELLASHAETPDADEAPAQAAE